MFPTYFPSTSVVDPGEGSSSGVPLVSEGLVTDNGITKIFDDYCRIPAEVVRERARLEEETAFMYTMAAYQNRLYIPEVAKRKNPSEESDKKAMKQAMKMHVKAIGKLGKKKTDEKIINYINILPESYRFGVAESLAGRSNFKIAKYISHFNLTPSECFKVAKINAKVPHSGLAEHIALFNLTPEELVEVARLLACTPHSDFAKHVRNFGPAELIQFAYSCATTADSDFAEHVGNFGCTDPTFLLKAAEWCAGTPNSRLAIHIKNFNITDPKEIYRLLQLSATQAGSCVAARIEDFPFLSDKERLNLAILCAKTEGSEIEKHIQKFNLSDKERLSVAKVRAQTKYSHLASHIKNFGLVDPKELFEVACLDAPTEGSEIERFIDNYGLTNHEDLFAIAKLCTTRCSQICSRIKNFNLTQTQRFEIAELYAQAYPKKVISRIRKFKLSEIQRFKIAELCMSTEPGKVLSNIIGFELSPEHLLQIAKLGVIQDAEAVAFALSQKSLLLAPDDFEEILLSCVENNPQATLKHLFSGGLLSDAPPQKRLEIFLLAAKKMGMEAYQEWPEMLNITKRGNVSWFDMLFVMAKKNKWDSEISKKILKNFIEKNFFNAPSLLKLVDAIEHPSPSEKEIHLQMHLHCWLASVLHLLHHHDLSEEEISFILEKNLLENLKAFKAPLLRNALGHLLPFVVKTKEDRAYLQGENLYSWEKKYKYTKVLRLVLVALSKDIPRENIQQFVLQLDKLKRKGKNLFVEARRFRTLVQALYLLSDNRALNPSEKEALFIRLTQEATVNGLLNADILMKNLYALIALIETGEAKKLNGVTSSLIQFHEEAFRRNVPLGKVESFTEAYLKTFGSTPRRSWAIRTYAAKMKACREPELMDALGLYTTSVLNGTWPAIRYDEEHNPHLKAMFSNFPDLREKWLKNKSYALTDLLAEGSSQREQVDMQEILRKNLIAFGHLDLSSLPELSLYLTTNEEEERQNLREKLQLREISKKDGDSYLEFLLQQQCIRLMQVADANEQLRCLEQIQATLSSHSTFHSSQFLKDVKVLSEQLIKADQLLTLSSYRVVETDDPFRLLLCGSDMGTCQSVDGDKANRGLEGYLLHGQTKLDAIIDQGENTVARTLSRLLLDENEKPVLFIEEIYPDGVRSEFKAALLEINRRRAKELGIPLLIQRHEKGGPYGQKLKSLGGRARYEYVDGSDGLQEEGKYTIEHAYYLDPQPEKGSIKTID